jgi:hypothetical protein
MDERELRKVVLVLVNAMIRSRRSLMATNMAIQAIGAMSPSERAILKPEGIKTDIAKFERQLAQQPHPNEIRIVKILEGSGDFLYDLRLFTSQLH